MSTVSIAPREFDLSQRLARIPAVTANPDGPFQIPAVPPGSYDVFARLPIAYGWGPGAPPDRAIGAWAIGRTTVEVRGSNVEGIRIEVSWR